MLLEIGGGLLQPFLKRPVRLADGVILLMVFQLVGKLHAHIAQLLLHALHPSHQVLNQVSLKESLIGEDDTAQFADTAVNLLEINQFEKILQLILLSEQIHFLP